MACLTREKIEKYLSENDIGIIFLLNMVILKYGKRCGIAILTLLYCRIV